MKINNLPPLPEGYAYRLDLARAAGNSLLKRRLIHRWFYFPQSYSPELVEAILQVWALPEGARILDPFVGAGTTLLVAKEKGCSAIGFDLLPLGIIVSNAKVAKYDQQAFCKSLHRIICQASRKTVRPSSWRLNRAFSTEEYAVFAALRKVLTSEPKEVQDFFLTALIGVLQEFSRTVADGGWFRWRDLPSRPEEIITVFEQRARDMLEDVPQVSPTSNGQSWRAVHQDAREVSHLEEAFDGLLTSPPYPNRHDYTRIFHIELLILGLSEMEIKELRYNTLRSNVEARAPFSRTNFQLPLRLAKLLNQLPGRTDRRILRMLSGYFEDLYLTLSAQGQILRPHANVALVVGNVRHGGVLFPVDEIVAEVGEQAGLRWVGTWVIRLRGNSAQQMGRYGRLPSRESVVFFEKPKS